MMQHVLTLSIIAVIFVLGLISYLKDKVNLKNRYFFLFTAFLCFWLAFLFYEGEVKNISVAQILLRLDYMFAPFVVLFFFLFCLNFPKINERVNKSRVLIILPSAFFFITAITNLVIKNIHFRDSKLVYDMGILYYLYAIYIVIYLGGGVIDLLFKFVKGKGQVRNQILYVCLGFFISSSFVIIFDVFVQPLFKASALVARLSIWGMLFFVGLTTYTITKHELMDIRVIIGRNLAYGIVGTFLIASFIAVNLTRMSVTLTTITNVLLGLLWAWGAHRLREFIQTPVDKWISWYKPEELLNSIVKELGLVSQREDAFKVIASQLKNKIKIKKVNILLGKKDDSPKPFEYDLVEKEEGHLKPLSSEHPFIANFREAIHYNKLTPEIKESIREFNFLRDDLYLPLFSTEGLEGIIILGQKVSEDPYDKKDLVFFETLVIQTKSFLDRIRPYEKIKRDFEANQQKLFEAERQLERAQRLSSLGRIVSEVAHEIRNPLTLVLAKAKEIKGTNGIPEAVRDSTDLILERADRIEKVVSTMRTLSQPPHYEPQEVEISEPIESALRFMPFKREIKIKKEYKQVPAVIGDKNELERVFINLFTNAYDAMAEKGGELSIRLQRENGWVRVEIEDTGVGISKEDLPKIFEPFFTTKFGKIDDRMGFGLSICHNIIVEKHKGTITAESAPGKGTKFIITLPAKIN